MNQDRRQFLQQLGTVCAGGVARTLGLGCTAAVATNAVASAPAAAAVGAVTVGAYGTGVRSQVFEVVVRQAAAGAPWKEICKGPMAINNITEAEIEAEVKRRHGVVHTDVVNCPCLKCVQSRWAKFREEIKAREAIPHSEKSPCACIDCRKAVDKILTEQTKKIKERIGLA
jgi:hypothetical protein